MGSGEPEVQSKATQRGPPHYHTGSAQGTQQVQRPLNALDLFPSASYQQPLLWFYNPHVTCSLLPVWQDNTPPHPVWSPSVRTHHSPLRPYGSATPTHQSLVAFVRAAFPTTVKSQAATPTLAGKAEVDQRSVQRLWWAEGIATCL